MKKDKLVVNRHLESDLGDTASENDADVLTQEVMNIIKAIKKESDTHKACSKCKKEGRPHIHPIDHFSTLKSGKLHPQCRKCRSRQATGWCKRKAKHRKEYHKKYMKTYDPNKAKTRIPPSKKSEADLSKAKVFIADIDIND